MHPVALQRRYGDRLVFWGGGIDTRQVLPVDTPEEVCGMVHERSKTFGPGGGYMFSAIHNVQANIPIENLLALCLAVAACRGFALQ